jgi:hypothetical protein
MRSFAIALVAFTMLSGAALAGDRDDTAASDAPAIVDDATFDAGFQCPETLSTEDSREAEFYRYVAWARAVHPDWNFKKRLDVRYGLLRRHACTQTLANIAFSGRPAFGH